MQPNISNTHTQNEKKTISISGKRQITIPQKFYEALGFNNEAECILQNNAILIRPVSDNRNEFSEYILSDLIAEGFSGQQLLDEFKKRNAQVKPATQELIEQAGDAARGIGKYTIKEK